MRITLIPVGDCRTISISAGNVWEMPFSLTAFTRTPVAGNPETDAVTGYGVPFPDALIVTPPPDTLKAVAATESGCITPAQTVGAAGVMMGVAGVPSTVTEAVFWQPVAVIVPVTVYTVVTVGEATTVGPVVVFSPVAGDQLYVFAFPLAVSVTGAQRPLGPELTVGKGFTVNEALLEVTLPHARVMTTRKRFPL
jgi:hypothetical protein